MGTSTQSQDKGLVKPPHTIEMSTEERVEFLANLIVDRIMADQQGGQAILKHIEQPYAALPAVAAA